MEGVEVLGADRSSTRDGAGIFARVLMEGWPDLPVATEDWFVEPHLCRDFFEHVLRHHNRRTLSRRGLDSQQSAELHTAHRLLLARLRVMS